MDDAALTALVVAGFVLALAIVLHSRRANRETRAQFSRGLLELGERLDGLAHELATAVETVREEGLRAQLVGTLGGTLDLDEILARCAEAAASLSGVAAAAVTVEIEGVARVACAGIDSGTPGAIVGPPDGRDVRAVGISYHYRDTSGVNGAMRSAVAVPIDSDDGRLGFLAVYGRDEEPPVAGADFKTLEAIAYHVGPAIVRARRVADRLPAANDALTGLAHRELLHETLALEATRAHRDRRTLAVCVLDVDDLRAINARFGQQVGDALLVEIARVLRTTIRPEDTVFRGGGDTFVVVLPGAARIEAEATFARAQASLHALSGPMGFTPSLSAGIAELKPDDDGVSLFERAERALRRAKEAGKGTAA